MIRLIKRLFKKEQIKKETSCLPDWLLEIWKNSWFYFSSSNISSSSSSSSSPLLPI